MMEGVALGVKAGLDPMTIYEVVKASSGGSRGSRTYPEFVNPTPIRTRLQSAADEQGVWETFNTIAKELHVPVSFANVAQQYQQMAIAAGLAEQDTSVVMTIIERLAAVEVSRPEQPVSPPPAPAR